MALAAEIADGWLPIYYSPTVGRDVRRRGWPRASPGRARRRRRPTFEIAANCSVVVTDDVDAALDAHAADARRSTSAAWARQDMNFHKQVFARMGYEEEADEIQDLFFEGKRDEAIAAVPDEMVADISLVGSASRSATSWPRWEEAGVTMLVVGAASVDQIRQHRRGRPRRVTGSRHRAERVLPCAR